MSHQQIPFGRGRLVDPVAQAESYAIRQELQAKAYNLKLGIPRTQSGAAGYHMFERVNTTTGAVTLTLPKAALGPGYVVRVKWIAGTNSAIVAAASGETIDGAASMTFSNLYESLDFMSNGTTWDIV